MRASSIFVAAALLGVGMAGVARADDPRVPTQGSEQGEIVPNALPDGGPAHRRAPLGHLTAPTGGTPQSSERLAGSRNSVPSRITVQGEAQPHADVTSNPAAVPNASEGTLRPTSAR